MTENEKLRALLAEARAWMGECDCRTKLLSPKDDAFLAGIDAALAEPHWSSQVLDAALEHEAKQIRKSHSEFLTQLQRERDEARAEVERLTQSLAMAEQVSGVLCDDCGWAMKFPGEPCRCKVVKQLDEARVEMRRTYIELSEAVSRNAEAYERGARAMRGMALNYAMNLDDVYEIRNAIRALPIPEEKP